MRNWWSISTNPETFQTTNLLYEPENLIVPLYKEKKQVGGRIAMSKSPTWSKRICLLIIESDIVCIDQTHDIRSATKCPWKPIWIWFCIYRPGKEGSWRWTTKERYDHCNIHLLACMERALSENFSGSTPPCSLSCCFDQKRGGVAVRRKRNGCYLAYVVYEFLEKWLLFVSVCVIWGSM